MTQLQRSVLGRLVSIVVRDFPLCGRFFILGVSLLFLFFGKQLHDALPTSFIRSLLKQVAVVFYILAPDKSEHGLSPLGLMAPEDFRP